MNIKEIKGFVEIHKENGEIINLDHNQIHKLIIENQNLRNVNKILQSQLENLTNHIEDNSIPISELKLQELLGENMGV